jgi:hypothetical protein
MNPVRKYLKNKKGIQTILAALLMVVIVVVASVMVYAWSTGLLGTLLVQPSVGKEVLNMDQYAFANNNNVTLYLRNAGSVAISFQTYYVKDSAGNQWQLNSWSPAGQPINPNSPLAVNVAIGSLSGQCGSACVYTGAASAFSAFSGGSSYTVLLVTTRNNQFSFTVTR